MTGNIHKSGTSKLVLNQPWTGPVASRKSPLSAPHISMQIFTDDRIRNLPDLTPVFADVPLSYQLYNP